MTKHFAKVLLDPQVAAKLTGSIALNESRPTELWSVVENETGMFVCVTCSEFLCPVPPESTEFARRISETSSRLFADAKAKRWLLSLDEDGDLVESATTLEPDEPLRGQREQQQSLPGTARSYNIQLNHGIELSVWNPSGELVLANIIDFLGEAMSYFKDRRSQFGKDLVWTGPDFAKPIARGHCPLGRLGLWQPKLESSEDLSLEEWCATVTRTYCIATTVEDFQQQLQQFLEHNDSPGLVPVFEALQTEPDGIQALELMLTRDQAFR